MTKTNTVPPWLTSRTGEPGCVPRPWTPVRMDERSLSCWGRKHVFGRSPVLEQVVNRGRPMLAGPIEFNYTLDGRDRTWRVCETTGIRRHPQGLWAEREAAGAENALMLRSSLRLYYEGAVRVDLVLHPLKPVTLDRLRIVIPFRPDAAIHGCARTSVFETDRLPDAGEGLG